MLRRLLLMAAVLATGAAGITSVAARPQAKIKLLVLSSETGHPFPQTTPILCKTLLDAGFDVELTFSLDRIKAPNGSKPFDVVVFNGRYPQRDEAAEKALIDFVNGGKGLVLIHIASNSFGGSDEWKKLCGRVWGQGSGHPPYGPFKVNVADAQSPIMAGISDFSIEDEMYQKLVVAEGAQEHVLAIATDGQRTDPMAFTLQHGSGRVFHTTLGHGPVCHRTPVFQKLVVQGVEWAAGRR
jgi:type 1 glutamine amidotransferase